jgi:hypothetical protein
MKYQVTSFSEGRNGGQITVTVGEGRNRRSFTRHLHRQGGVMVGLSIDERAIPLNELYEDELAIAKGDLACAERRLKEFQKKLEAIEVAPDGADIAAESELAIYHVGLQEQVEAAEATVIDATKAVDDAETKLDIVRRDLPLMMEFRRY